MNELGGATWPEVESAGSTALLAIPVGSTEQHGPHLPLSTDTEIATALAERGAGQVPGMVVAPALPYGSSGEHADFPGTLSIGQEATELALVELCRSASHSFERTILVSAHGGNAQPLRAAVQRLRYEGREVRAWSPSWKGDAHAGRVETSLMLALAPERVRFELASPGNVDPIERLFDDLVESGVRPLAESGVLGDPTGASAEEGEQLLATAVADLVRTIGAWRRHAVEARR
jgi:creatinine amidohydrolase